MFFYVPYETYIWIRINLRTSNRQRLHSIITVFLAVKLWGLILAHSPTIKLNVLTLQITLLHVHKCYVEHNCTKRQRTCNIVHIKHFRISSLQPAISVVRAQLYTLSFIPLLWKQWGLCKDTKKKKIHVHGSKQKQICL